MSTNCNGNGFLDDNAGGNCSPCPGCDACRRRGTDVTHKDRPDLAADAVEVAIFGVGTQMFTLILSGIRRMAWIEIEGPEKIQIAFTIDAIAHLVLSYVLEQRTKNDVASTSEGKLS